MKAKLLVIFTVLALALALPHPAAATITPYNLNLNNIGGQGITFTFKFDTSAEGAIAANTLYFTGDNTGTSGGTFVRFDKIGYNTSGITLSSSASDSATWSTVGNPPGNCNADGFGTAQGCIAVAAPGTTTTPIGSTWTFSGGLVGPLDAHVIFANGCTFWASTNPGFNGNTTSSTDSQTGACAGSLTPEPSSLVLFGGGLLGLAAFIRRRPNLWASMWAARA
jgi:hypothetical protein